ncbi:MAG: hypothetical protein ACO1OO_06970 [Flavisolibacter sp.]
MKIAVLFLLIFTSAIANGQSLKDALFSGKLKTDTGTVVRKTDDLSTKIDSNRKVQPAVVQTAAVKKDSAGNVVKAQAQPAVKTSEASTVVTDDASATTTETNTEATAAPQDNTDVWNTFMDAFQKTLKEEVLPLKKIKSDKYYVSLFYAIEKDGTVSVTDVLVSPESKELQDQIRRRLTLDTPQLEPVTSSTGAARRVTKKYNFTITKE